MTPKESAVRLCNKSHWGHPEACAAAPARTPMIQSLAYDFFRFVVGVSWDVFEYMSITKLSLES